MTSFPVILSLHTHPDSSPAADSFVLHLISKGEAVENGWVDEWLIKMFLLAQHFHFLSYISTFVILLCPPSVWNVSVFHWLIHLFLHPSSIWDFVWSFPEDRYSPSLFWVQSISGSGLWNIRSIISNILFSSPFLSGRAERDCLMLSPPNDSRVHHLSRQRSALQSSLAASRSWLSISCAASNVFKKLLKPFTTLLRVWYMLI